MVLPTIHLNGTSRKELIAQYEQAMDAVQDAINSLREAYPNGRDYYPQGPGTIEIAMEEHAARMNNLFAVRKDLETILSHILDQRKAIR